VADRLCAGACRHEAYKDEKAVRRSRGPIAPTRAAELHRHAIQNHFKGADQVRAGGQQRKTAAGPDRLKLECRQRARGNIRSHPRPIRTAAQRAYRQVRTQTLCYNASAITRSRLTAESRVQIGHGEERFERSRQRRGFLAARLRWSISIRPGETRSEGLKDNGPRRESRRTTRDHILDDEQTTAFETRSRPPFGKPAGARTSSPPCERRGRDLGWTCRAPRPRETPPSSRPAKPSDASGNRGLHGWPMASRSAGSGFETGMSKLLVLTRAGAHVTIPEVWRR